MRIFILLFMLAPLFLWGQYPDNPRKLRLGFQTTGAGLTYIKDGAPAHTPGDDEDAWMVLDTANNVLYYWDETAGAWENILDDITQDTVFQITNVPDTTTLAPMQGDAFINSTADTLGLYNGAGWVLFFGGGSSGSTETADGLTILGDGTGGGPFRVDTTLLATRTYADSLFAVADSLREAGDRSTPILIQAFDRIIQLDGCSTSETVITGFYLLDDTAIDEGEVTFEINASPQSITYDVYNADSTSYYFETSVSRAAGIYTWEVGYTDPDGNFVGDTNLFEVAAGTPDTVTVWLNDSISVTRRCGVEISRDTIIPADNVTGTGTTNYLSKWTGANTLGNSWLSQSDNVVVLASGKSLSGSTGSQIGNVGTCANPVSAQISSIASPTGAIEIALPTGIFGGGAGNSFEVSFIVSVHNSSGVVYNFYASINGDSGPTVYAGAVSSLGTTLFNGQYRIGSESGVVKVWIGELAQTWGSIVSVEVKEVNVYRYLGSVSVDVCQGWAAAWENSAFGTVTRSGSVSSMYSRVLGGVQTGTGFHEERRPIFAGVYPGSFTGAIEITLPAATANLSSALTHIRFKGSINLGSVAGPVKDFYISGTYYYLTKAWSNVMVEWIGGPPPESVSGQYKFRFGDDGTRGKIWIGELTSIWSGKYLVLSDLSGVNSSVVHTDLIGTPWSVGTESTAFDNIDATVLSSSTEMTIPVITGYGYAHSGNIATGVKLPGGTTAQRPTGADGIVRYNTTENLYESYANSAWRLFPYMDASKAQLVANNYKFNVDQSTASIGGLSMVYNSANNEWEATERAHALLYNGTMDSIQTTGSSDYDLIKGWQTAGEKSSHWTLTDTSAIYAGPTIIVRVELNVSCRASSAGNHVFQIGHATGTGTAQFIVTQGQAETSYLRASPDVTAVHRAIQFEVQNGYEIKTRGGGVNGGIGITDGGILISQVN